MGLSGRSESQKPAKTPWQACPGEEATAPKDPERLRPNQGESVGAPITPTLGLGLSFLSMVETPAQSNYSEKQQLPWPSHLHGDPTQHRDRPGCPQLQQGMTTMTHV